MTISPRNPIISAADNVTRCRELWELSTSQGGASSWTKYCFLSSEGHWTKLYIAIANLIYLENMRSIPLTIATQSWAHFKHKGQILSWFSSAEDLALSFECCLIFTFVCFIYSFEMNSGSISPLSPARPFPLWGGLTYELQRKGSVAISCRLIPKEVRKPAGNGSGGISAALHSCGQTAEWWW